MKTITLFDNENPIADPLSGVNLDDLDEMGVDNLRSLFNALQQGNIDDASSELSHLGVSEPYLPHMPDRFDPYKDAIVRNMLLSLKEYHDSYDYIHIVCQIDALENMGVRWPELKSIRRGLDAMDEEQSAKGIREDDRDRNLEMRLDADYDRPELDAEELMHDLFRNTKDVGDLEDIILSMDEMGVNENEVDKLVQDNLDYILYWFDDSIHRNPDQHIVRFLLSLFDLFELSDPIVAGKIRETLEPNKDVIVKGLLVSIKYGQRYDENPNAIRRLTDMMKRIVDWSELDIITRSINAGSKPMATIGEGLYSGQAWKIEHVAKKLKKQLDDKMDLQVTYTLQDLSRTDPKEVEQVLRPLDGDFAAWFERFASSNSVMYGLGEIGWLLNYTDCRWPKLKAAVDARKDDILKRMLKSMKMAPGDYNPKSDLRILRDIGINWPEIGVIERSARTDAKRLGESELRANQQAIVDTWYKRLHTDLEHDYYDLAAWALIMMGRADAQLSQPPDKPFFNRHKGKFLKSILTTVANKDGQIQYSDRELRELMLGARKLDLDWPELNVIERSLRADMIVGESASDTVSDQEAKLASLSAKLDWLHTSLHDPSSWNNLRISLLMDSTHILNRMDTGYTDTIVPILEGHKDSIIRAMVLMIKNRGLDAWSVRNAVQSLQRFVPSWKELQTIWKSLKAEGLDDGKKLLKAAGLDEVAKVSRRTR